MMRWKGREKSENVEDRRGARPVGLVLGGGGLLTIVIALVAMFLGADPRAFMGLVEQPQGQPAQRAQQCRASTMRPKSLSPLCSRIPRMSGHNFFARAFREAATSHPNWFCSPVRFEPHAAWPTRLWGPSIVRRISKSTSTPRFLRN